MCHECSTQFPPEGPRGLTRRSMLGLAAAAVGGLTLGFYSCQNTQPQPRTTTEPGTVPATEPTSLPATTATTTTTTTTTTEAATEPAITSPSPNLGAELFPDPTGRPLASAKDAPLIVIPRSDWTPTGPNLAQVQPMGSVERITVHHTAWAWLADAWSPTAVELENVRQFHAGTRPSDRHWGDIAYHFAIDRAGRAWQARPLAYQGAHVRLHNFHNLGIVLLGNFEVQSPTAAQCVALESLIGFARKLYHIPLADVFTHGELASTGCPGKKLQSIMNRSRRKWAATEGVAWNGPTTQAIAASTMP